MTDKFEYTYSAPTEDERAEIESIRNTYIQHDNYVDSDLKKLRKLDQNVKNPPLILALVVGIIGTLIFGLGITFATEWTNLAVGIPVGLFGAMIMTVNPFVHKVFLAHRKQKYGEKIIALSDKLLDDKKS